MRRRADRARTRPVRVAQSRPKPRRADDRVRGEPIALLAGARTAEAIVPAIECDDCCPGHSPPGGPDVAASRCRRCSRPAFARRRTKAIVGDPQGPTRDNLLKGGQTAAAPQLRWPRNGPLLSTCNSADGTTEQPHSRRVPAAGRGRGIGPDNRRPRLRYPPARQPAGPPAQGLRPSSVRPQCDYAWRCA